ncbi:hypothetical protein VR479_11255 [Aquirufa aurantiipilula]
MRSFYPIIISFLIAHSPLLGQIEFKDPLSPFHYRIDVSTKKLWKENTPGDWISQGNLNLEKIDLAQLTNNPKFESFYSNGKIFLILDGTGQVYHLNLLTKTFARMDKTFYRGYNFQSVKFLRKDTLYSFGGIGFWHANNIESYFSTKSSEWELKSISSENGPSRIKKSFGGYDAKRDVVSIIEFPALYAHSDIPFSYKYFEKNMTVNKWELKGNLNIELLNKIGLFNLKSEYKHGLFFFQDGQSMAMGDPEKNEIYQFENPQDILNSDYELSEKNGVLCSYFKQKVLKDGNKIKLDSISIEELKSRGVVRGKFYIQENSTWQIGAVIGSIFILVFIFWWFGGCKHKAKKRNEELIIPELTQSLEMKLPDGAYSFLKLCLEHPKGFEFSSQLFTEHMGYSNYSYETQRQIRSKLIKAINTYFKVHHQLDEVIIRKPAINDKRFSIYLISEIHYDTLVDLFTT